MADQHLYIEKTWKKKIILVYKNQNLNEAASNLYKVLRLIKRKGYKNTDW